MDDAEMIIGLAEKRKQGRGRAKSKGKRAKPVGSGRKPLPPEQRRKAVSVYLLPVTYQRLTEEKGHRNDRKVMGARETSMSDLLEEMVEAWFTSDPGDLRRELRDLQKKLYELCCDARGVMWNHRFYPIPGDVVGVMNRFGKLAAAIETEILRGADIGVSPEQVQAEQARLVPDERFYLFDLDGTLVSGYMDNPDKAYHSWQVLPGRVDRLAALKLRGYSVAIVTNQGGVAFGHTTEPDFERKIVQVAQVLGLHDGVSLMLGDGKSKTLTGPGLLSVFVCYNDRRSSDPRYQDDARRKPSGAMIREAAEQFKYSLDQVVYVGDRPEDEAAAADAGVRFEWAEAFFSGA